MTLSIEAVNLSKRYDSFYALSDLNLKIEGSRKCVGFLGPNGAGKTTTLKIFTALIFPTKGEALINGINVTHDKKGALGPCGVLIETPEIYPSATPKEALTMIGQTRGIPRDERQRRIGEVLAEVKMEEWADKRVGKFSKGMKQRINIAAALLSDPDILLLDEPSTGLDPRGMAEVRDIVRSLKQHDKLIFMSSHLLGEVTDVCDEVAMIDHGKLLVYDKLANILAKTTTGDSAVEIAFSRPIDDNTTNTKISAIPGIISVDRIDEKNLRLKFKGDVESQEEILSQLAAMKLGLISFRRGASALEETYLDLIKDSK